MNKSLHYISISHNTATVNQRLKYHIPEEEKCSLVILIRNTFLDITGLTLLITCNRIEIYFESTHTSASVLRDFFINVKGTLNTIENQKLFQLSNNTEETVRHLLEVSSGLDSSILGDAEIIHQIKKSHQFSIAHKLQGSLLERAMQTVFKSHKRVSNETRFRDGTTSVAYKSLKVIRDTYGKIDGKTKKILIVGAGDIVKQLFEYNTKFKFNNIYISNRTEERAITLANKHQSKVYDWNEVIANNFQDFDVIISAVNNCQHLIQKATFRKEKTILIDLAVPANMDKKLANNKNILFYDLESISEELEETKEKRISAIEKVNKIINEELLVYIEWLQGASLRTFLAEYKITVHQKVVDYFETDLEEDKINTVTNQVMRKVLKQTEILSSHSVINEIISKQVSLSGKIHP